VITDFTPCGTPMYMSPELFASYSQGKNKILNSFLIAELMPKFNPFISDVFSLGLTICAMRDYEKVKM